jgi:ABC-type sugar transport system ATPase subunit
LDEPTKGIDVSTKRDILKIIREELTKSAGLILTSSELEDLMLICDRILILYKGKIIGEYPKDKFKEEDLYLTMQGYGKK